MFKRERRNPELEKLNLVPIMDAVFIFIFFLLFSAQFIKLFEIEAEAPIVSEVPSNRVLEKEPLNLKVKIYEGKLELTQGLDEKVIHTYLKNESAYLNSMKNELIKIRKANPNESHIIISPIPSIKYNEIIQVIDSVQNILKNEKVSVKTKAGEITLKKLFKQIVLEPIDNV